MGQLHLLDIAVVEKDVCQTPDEVARDVVRFFDPRGVCLDPCRGDGAFYRYLPAGTDWCEIGEGRDFFAYDRRVDWIVSNPPYSVFSQWLRHSFTVADDIVYLIPVNKAFNSYRLMREIYEWGGIRCIYVVDSGGRLGFEVGFAVGAVHFRRGYRGFTEVVFRENL